MTQAAVAPVLVFGWGNLSRGDDALGPLCIARLREMFATSDSIEFLEDYQLQVEHALDLAGRQRVLFVDASLTCPAPFEVNTLEATQDASFTTHAMSPQALMHVYTQLQGEPAPSCTLLAIRGERYELGEAPTAQALDHLQAAVQWAQQWLTQPAGAATH
jgi:hydrogenase maturation protease